jgi:hypothetical protein
MRKDQAQDKPRTRQGKTRQDKAKQDKTHHPICQFAMSASVFSSLNNRLCVWAPRLLSCCVALAAPRVGSEVWFSFHAPILLHAAGKEGEEKSEKT